MISLIKYLKDIAKFYILFIYRPSFIIVNIYTMFKSILKNINRYKHKIVWGQKFENDVKLWGYKSQRENVENYKSFFSVIGVYLYVWKDTVDRYPFQK